MCEDAIFFVRLVGGSLLGAVNVPFAVFFDGLLTRLLLFAVTVGHNAVDYCVLAVFGNLGISDLAGSDALILVVDRSQFVVEGGYNLVVLVFGQVAVEMHQRDSFLYIIFLQRLKISCYYCLRAFLS